MEANLGPRDFWAQVLGPGWQSRGPYVVNIMARRIGLAVRDDGEDVFQEALRRCLIWVGRHGGPKDVTPEETTKVLQGIVKNVLREKKRSDGRRGTIDPNALETLLAAHWLDEEGVAKLVEGELYPRLTARQRQVFELNCLSRLSQKDVAGRLGTSVPTVCREMQVVLDTFRGLLLGRRSTHEPRTV